MEGHSTRHESVWVRVHASAMDRANTRRNCLLFIVNGRALVLVPLSIGSAYDHRAALAID